MRRFEGTTGNCGYISTYDWVSRYYPSESESESQLEVKSHAQGCDREI